MSEERSTRATRRTCVACREEADRDALIRLVLDPEGQLVVDLRARLPGRGAWVHPDPGCLARLEKEPGRLGRALEAQVTTAGLGDLVRRRLIDAVLDGLSLASAAGALVGGHDAVELAIRDQRIAELVVAADAAERTVRDLTRGVDLPTTVLPMDKEDLGARIGQPPRAVVGLVGSPAFRHLREQLRRMRSLG